MNQEQLTTLLNIIKATSNNPEMDKVIAGVLKLAADSITLDTLKELTASGKSLPQVESPANKKAPVKGRKENDSDENFGIIISRKRRYLLCLKIFNNHLLWTTKL